jgi:hypothetical protein
MKHFEDPADSLALGKPSEYGRVLQLLADEFGAMDAALTSPEQREVFDPVVRMWPRE